MGRTVSEGDIIIRSGGTLNCNNQEIRTSGVINEVLFEPGSAVNNGTKLRLSEGDSVFVNEDIFFGELSIRGQNPGSCEIMGSGSITANKLNFENRPTMTINLHTNLNIQQRIDYNESHYSSSGFRYSHVTCNKSNSKRNAADS